MRAVSSIAVSVIIPCHNAADYLADALRSVRDQTLRDFECLIIDDSSTDGSETIAKRFVEADPRFRLISLNQNHGPSAARNAGIAQATGQWIALLDADDLFLPGRLELLTGVGDRDGADLIFDDQLVTEFPSAVSIHHAFGFTQREFSFSQEDFFSGSRLFRRSFPTGYMKPLIRRDFLIQSKAAYDPLVLSGEDFLFYSQLFAARPRCTATSFAGYVYRRRRGSLSRSDKYLHFHAQLGERVLSEFGAQLSPHSRAALAGRRQDFEQLTDALPALSAFRQGEWSRLVRSLFRRPRSVVTCLLVGRTRLLRSWFALSGVAMRSITKAGAL